MSLVRYTFYLLFPVLAKMPYPSTCAFVQRDLLEPTVRQTLMIVNQNHAGMATALMRLPILPVVVTLGTQASFVMMVRFFTILTIFNVVLFAKCFIR